MQGHSPATAATTPQLLGASPSDISHGRQVLLAHQLCLNPRTWGCYGAWIETPGTIDVPFCLGRTGVPNFDSYPSRDAIDSCTAQGFACFDQHLLIEWLEYLKVSAFQLFVMVWKFRQRHSSIAPPWLSKSSCCLDHLLHDSISHDFE